MLLIAEIGINHDGVFDKALKMIQAAYAAGADIAKFQYYNPLKLLGKDSPYLEYATQCQFTKKQLERLKAYCDEVGLEFLVSVFDVKDIPWANKLCKRHKVASRMNKDKKFLKALLKTKKQVIMSTQDVSPKAINGVTYMHCVTEYPTVVNKLLDIPYSKILGISSHCSNLAPTIRAINLGAQVIEHHVCFSRQETGCDKTSSITFSELAAVSHCLAKAEAKAN